MENLGLDIKLLLAQVVNFVIFFVIFKKFIAKPFSNFLRMEVDKEKEKQKILDDLEKKAEAMEKKQSSFDKKIKDQNALMLENAKSEAAKIKEELIKNAKSEAENILNKAKIQIEDERRKLTKELRSQAIDLGTYLVTKALDKSIDDETRKKITNNIIQNEN